MIQKFILKRIGIPNEYAPPCRGNGALVSLGHFVGGVLASVADAELGGAYYGGGEALAVEFEAACFTAGASFVGGGSLLGW